MLKIVVKLFDSVFLQKGVIIDMEQSSYRVREGGADVTACVRMVGQSSIYNTLFKHLISPLFMCS